MKVKQTVVAYNTSLRIIETVVNYYEVLYVGKKGDRKFYEVVGCGDILGGQILVDGGKMIYSVERRINNNASILQARLVKKGKCWTGDGVREGFGEVFGIDLVGI